MRVQSGDAVQLGDTTTGASAQIIVGASAGWAELRDVQAADGRVGMVAFQPNGDWWWIRELSAAPNDVLPRPFSVEPEEDGN